MESTPEYDSAGILSIRIQSFSRSDILSQAGYARVFAVACASMAAVATKELIGSRIILRLLLVLYAVIIGSCGGETGGAYPENVRASYISACIQSGGDRKFCECTLQVLERQLSYQEFRGMETGIISGDRPAVEKMSAVMEDVNRICKLENRMQR
jgi:hypothetical protein